MRHWHWFVWHRHAGYHPPRGRFTGGWHGHVCFHHEHGPDGRGQVSL